MSSTRVTDFFQQQRAGASKSAPGKQQQTAAAAPQGASSSKPSPDQCEANEANEAVLRQFDLQSTFGPCKGITRLQRCAAAAHQAPPTGGQPAR
jgi:hypothetical protein